jgi:hypothetical protein
VGVRARPFHRKQHRAAPFAAEPETLDEANNGQDDSAPNADLLVGRDKAHGKGRKAGQQQGRDQRRLAAYPIPVMAEDRRPDGAGHKTDSVDGERLQHTDERIGPGKEELAEDQSGHLAVEQKIVPFDRRTDRACDHGPTKLRAMIGLRQGTCYVVDRRHIGVSPIILHSSIASGVYRIMIDPSL